MNELAQAKAQTNNVRDLLIAKIHEAFTIAADQLAMRGYLDQAQRIRLSSLIGDMLGKMNEQIDAAVAAIMVSPDDVNLIAAKAAEILTHMENEIKSGARHSAGDQKLIQNIHDAALELGAASPQSEPLAGFVPVKTEDTVVAYGGEIKALQQDGHLLHVGGYLVRFGDEQSPDISAQKDFFTPDTDFGFATKSHTWFHHTLPVEFVSTDGKKKQARITREFAPAELSLDDIGVFAKAVLDERDAYEKMIATLVKTGKIGWSSGTASHLIKRTPMSNGTNRIDRWLLGDDASYTHAPAEPSNTVNPIKSLEPFEVQMPEAEAEAGNRADAADAAPIKIVEESSTQASAPSETEQSEENKMELTAEQKAELLAEFQAASAPQQADAIKAAVVEALKNQPPHTPQSGVKTAGAKTPGFPTLLKFADGMDGGAVKAYSPQALAQFTGEDDVKTFLHYVRTGDDRPLRELKASNAVAMQEDTAGEGGNTVPTGLFNGIIARRNEISLQGRLGLRNIPGKGKTVDVPYDNEADGEFITTNEEAGMDADSPDIGKASMTLVKKTKKITISWELLQDEDVNLLAFLADWVGRGMAKTENDMILTEVAANGTAFKTFAAAAAIAAGEPEDILYNSNVSYYLDDGGSNAWVARPGTYAAIAKLTGNPRQYAETPQGGNASQMRPSLIGYPVFFSEKAAAIAASAKPLYFGNWYYVGYREAPGLTFLRDEYSRADNGQVVLRYYFRRVYKVLQAAAVGYGVHPSA